MSDPTEKPYGHEIVVEFCDRMIYAPDGPNNWKKTFGYRGSVAAARRRGMLHPHARAVISVLPLTREQFEFAYGMAQRM